MGCLYLENLLTEQIRKYALLDLFVAKENRECVYDENVCDEYSGFNFAFKDNQLMSLCDYVKPTLEKILDMELYPTYSFSRIYQEGDILPLHVDRNSCEISISITLGYGGNFIWPLVFMPLKESSEYIDFVDDGSDYPVDPSIALPLDHHQLQKIIIHPGDGFLYRGMQVIHGRPRYTEGMWQAQVFLHFVDANGKNTKHKFDQIDQKTIQYRR